MALQPGVASFGGSFGVNPAMGLELQRQRGAGATSRIQALMDQLRMQSDLQNRTMMQSAAMGGLKGAGEGFSKLHDYMATPVGPDYTQPDVMSVQSDDTGPYTRYDAMFDPITQYLRQTPGAAAGFQVGAGTVNPLGPLFGG